MIENGISRAGQLACFFALQSHFTTPRCMSQVQLLHVVKGGRQVMLEGVLLPLSSP
jgi:hypothetical protein